MKRLFALGGAAADAVHEEQRTADDEDHDRHRDEGEATRAVALLTGVDQLLRTHGHGKQTQRADHQEDDEEQSSAHAYASTRAGVRLPETFAASCSSRSRQCSDRRPSPNSRIETL